MKVTEPESFIEQIKQRLRMQNNLKNSVSQHFFSVKRTTHMCIIKINKGANSNRFYRRLPVFADRFSGFDFRTVY